MIVSKAVNGEAVFHLGKPSDCLVLKRDDIQCSTIKHMLVSSSGDMLQSLYGTPPEESTDHEVFNQAVTHLVETYHPMYLEFRCAGSIGNTKDTFRLHGECAEFYEGKWDNNCLEIRP